MPISHLIDIPHGLSYEQRREAEQNLVGATITVKVIEVNRRQRRLIMSERRAVREWRANQKEELLDELEEGEVRTGRVSSIADFGVFVDLGGADGLVHISELTYERGKHPRDVVDVGEDVEVYVLSLDHDRKRIGLSMKRLQQDPWTTVEDDHYVGQIVDAEITNLTKFGAFARLPNGLEGLIHISELSDEHVEHPKEIVRPGQKVAVEIISIDAERQRIGLSMRRVPEHLRLPEEAAEEETEEAAEEAESPSAEAGPLPGADDDLPPGETIEGAAEDTGDDVGPGAAKSEDLPPPDQDIGDEDDDDDEPDEHESDDDDDDESGDDDDDESGDDDDDESDDDDDEDQDQDESDDDDDESDDDDEDDEDEKDD